MFATFEQWLSAEAFAAFLVFARVGMAVAVLPGIGEVYVSSRIRLILAGGLALLLAPTVRAQLPPEPGTPVEMLLLLGGEIGIGIFIGTATRMTLNALQTAGAIVGMQTSLSAALAFDPSTAQQGALTGSFLGAVALIVIFAGDFHHLMIRAIADSYTLFPPGQSWPTGDFAQAMVQLVSSSFSLGVRMAAPFVVFGVVFFLGLGLLARLMPQMQVFFVSQPAQILLGLILLAATLVASMSVFINSFEDALSIFIAPPPVR
jgi:flagellar biosynthesis protein FliR